MKDRIFGYDLVRALAVLMVMTNHTMYLIYNLFPSFIANITMPFGDLGVVMFFVLSGYLIGDIFIKEIGNSGKFSFSMLFNFMQRRWFRTVPNYLFFLGLYYFLYLLAHNKMIDFSFAYWWDTNLNISPDKQIISMLVFLHNFFSNSVSGFMGHTWSLSVEEWFYILIPIVVFGLFHLFKISFESALLFIILIIVIASPVLRFAIYYKTGLSEFNFVVVRLDQIVFGVLFAWLKNYYGRFITLQKGLYIKLAIIAFSYLIYIKLVLVEKPLLEYDIFYKTLFPLLFAWLLISIENIKPNIPIFLKNLITSISVYSYSMYLCHFLVTIFFIDYFFKNHFENQILACLFLYIMFVGICFIWGKYQYHYFEKPLTKLRDRFK